ncbi:hypothetical protein GCM10011517_07660 [Actibacterium pelagium]|uniref:Uncharacterized protein n=1 Tax=Actibacterium pelagium TaxID=2029103 RepID=A0A917ADL7_9RHOB|nr:hypothetical protein GCM10011517_07660 [Actibacterium pelagium]
MLAQPTVLDPITLLVGTTIMDLPAPLRSRLKDRVESLPLVYIHAVLSRAPETREIITPLFSDTFDAMELAEELNLADYTGALTVIAPSLPEPTLVLQELQMICPDVQVKLEQRAPH